MLARALRIHKLELPIGDGSYNLKSLHNQGPNDNRGFDNISGAKLKCCTVQQRFMHFADQVRFR